ncbi:hypothetical protein VSR68_33205 [Paraburkholderia phymatum]
MTLDWHVEVLSASHKKRINKKENGTPGCHSKYIVYRYDAARIAQRIG